MIKTVIDYLVSTFKAEVISRMPVRPRPNDIDVYISSIYRIAVVDYLKSIGFVCLVTEQKCAARLWINSECYYLDIAFNPNYHFLNKVFKTMSLTERFTQLARSDHNLERFSKYVLSLIKTEKAISYVKENFDVYFSILCNTSYVENPIFLPNINRADMIGAMRGNILSMLRVFGTASTFKIVVYKIVTKLQRFATGQIIAVVGPDGSGKSTVIEKLSGEVLAKKMYMGDWGFVLQPLYDKLHQQNIWIARLSYVFFYFENWLRYLKAYYFKLLGETVIIDRYPGLNRHLRRNNFWLRLNDIMYFFFPRADKYIFISAPPEVIYKRRAQLTSSEIAQTQSNIRARLFGKDYLEVININLDECLNSCLSYILLDKRNKI